MSDLGHSKFVRLSILCFSNLQKKMFWPLYAHYVAQWGDKIKLFCGYEQYNPGQGSLNRFFFQVFDETIE